MASTSVAAAGAAGAKTAMNSVTVHPPASPFAELLRRSRFATFDPKIRQTYTTPPAHAHRGNWGLKRPLALRRRNAFITLAAPFEDRAQFIEWERAEDEVRFVRRFEETQVFPRPKPRTNWAKTLGTKNMSNWIMDSEFCHRYEGPEVEEESSMAKLEAERVQKIRVEQLQQNIPPDLAGFGKKGPKQYTDRRMEDRSMLRLTPNIDAMMPREFERYVRRLRELRPKFKQYLQSTAAEKLTNAKDQAATDATADPDLPNKNLFALAQNRKQEHHRQFIEYHTSEQFADVSAGVIEQRPHQAGGLLYSHLSNLHTHLFARPQPGIVLQNALEQSNPMAGRDAGRETVFIASFAGMTPVISKDNRGDKLPLLDHNSSEGIKREDLARSVARMRLVPGSVQVEEPPLSVARNASGLRNTRLTAAALVVDSQNMFSQSNPYPPGSMEYVALEPANAKGRPSTPSLLTNPVKYQRRVNKIRVRPDAANTDHIVAALSNMMARNGQAAAKKP